MGEIVEALDEVEGADRFEVAARQASIKAAAQADAIEAALSEDGRLVLDRGDGRVITLGVTRHERMIELDVEWTIDGKSQPFNNPWFIVNPPVLVLDPNGDIVRERRHPDTGEVVETIRYREDALAALIEIVDDKLRRPVETVEGRV